MSDMLSKLGQAYKDAGMDSAGILRNVPTECRTCQKQIEESYLHASLYNGQCYRCQKTERYITTLGDGCVVYAAPGYRGPEAIWSYPDCDCTNGRVWKNGPHHSYLYQCPKCWSRFYAHPARQTHIEAMPTYLLSMYNEMMNDALEEMKWQYAVEHKLVSKTTKRDSHRAERVIMELHLNPELTKKGRELLAWYKSWVFPIIDRCYKDMERWKALQEEWYPHMEMTEEERKLI